MVDGQVVENNSATAVAEPAASGQSASVSSGTLEGQSGQANSGQSASTEESFSSIDPKTLSPEMQAVYKSLQADYTKKLQPMAEVRKKAEAYDQVSKDQRFVDYWRGLNQPQKAEFKEQKAEVEKTLGQIISDEDFQKAFNSKDGFLDLVAKVSEMRGEKSQKKIQELENKLTVKDANDVISAFRSESGKDGKPVRPDFDSLEEDGLITGFLRVNPPDGKSQDDYLKRLNEAYSWSRNISQKYREAGKSEALRIIQAKSASSSEPPTGSAKGAYTGPDPKKLSVKEAIDLAKKGIRVTRDD